MWSKVACTYAAGVGNGGGGGQRVSGRRGGQRGGVEEEPAGSGDLTVRPVCGFQTLELPASRISYTVQVNCSSVSVSVPERGQIGRFLWALFVESCERFVRRRRIRFSVYRPVKLLGHVSLYCTSYFTFKPSDVCKHYTLFHICTFIGIWKL